MKIVIVSENISMKMGGEASLGLYYFRLFRRRGVEVVAVCHARVRDEINASLPEAEAKRFHFIEDTPLQAFAWRVSELVPPRIRDLIFGQAIHMVTMRRVRRLVQTLCANSQDWICLEPSPITPLGVSFMYGLGIPVVIGPLCGGLEFPPAFRYLDGKFTRATVKIGRAFSEVINRLIPGKLQADTLLVANECTRRALPKGCRGQVYEVVESGVDLAIWSPRDTRHIDANSRVRFVFSGRFVDWKGISFMVDAFQYVAGKTGAVLELIGDGEMRSEIEKRIGELRIEDKVILHGWKSRPEAAEIIRNCDVFVMPSLRECGGTAILEAMALGLPVVATNWAGPSSYVAESSGILVDPLSKEEFIQGLSDAMLRLAEAPELRRSMGRAGIDRVRTCYFDWDSKSDRVLEILRETLRESSNPIGPPQPTNR